VTAGLTHLLEICNDNPYTDDENDNLFDLGGAECKPQFSLKQMEFSLKQLPNGWGWPTTVHSTSERKHVWLGFWRRSIS
jgi:hypothetical protein